MRPLLLTVVKTLVVMVLGVLAIVFLDWIFT